MPVDSGSITPNSAQAATAASAAVPPALSTSIPTSAACGCDVATIAFWAWTVERPARWKFLMLNGSSHRCLAKRSLAKREAFSLRFLSPRFLAHSSPTRQWLGGLVAPFESADLPPDRRCGDDAPCPL